jgi:hypothetical protein
MMKLLHRYTTALLLLSLLTPVAFAQRMYDGSSSPIGRADGLRRMQMVVFFYVFM